MQGGFEQYAREYAEKQLKVSKVGKKIESVSNLQSDENSARKRAQWDLKSG
jgi:hypothetical protein